jgi:glucokinase
LSAAAPLTLGVDIGGTKIAAGLVDAQGSILFQTRVPMCARDDAETGFAAVKNAIEAVFAALPDARVRLAGIGICAPGPLDPRTGVVLNPPNVPCWRNFPLAAEVQRVFNVCAKVDNDANAAALAEAIWGAGVGFRNVFYATLGTGIGTGIIFDRRIYHGRTEVPPKAGTSASITTDRAAAAGNAGASRRFAPDRQSLCEQLRGSRRQVPNRGCEISLAAN